MAKKGGLGRGLGDILEDIGLNYESQFNEVIESNNSVESVAEIDVGLIDPNPYQPRKHFDEKKLQELSDSIKRHGLLQPIVVISVDDRYILIAGERRLRATKLARLDTIKAIVAQIDLDEIRLRELALIENIQRENLNPIELAQSYKELIEVHNITHEELSNIVNKSRSQITNTLRLLNLNEYVQEKLISNEISQGHAKILVGLDEKEQRVLTDTILGQKLSVRDLEQLVSKVKSKKTSISKEKEKLDYKIPKKQLQEILQNFPFETKIKKQSVEILLHSNEELEDFIAFIKKQ